MPWSGLDAENARRQRDLAPHARPDEDLPMSETCHGYLCL